MKLRVFVLVALVCFISAVSSVWAADSAWEDVLFSKLQATTGTDHGHLDLKGKIRPPADIKPRIKITNGEGAKPEHVAQALRVEHAWTEGRFDVNATTVARFFPLAEILPRAVLVETWFKSPKSSGANAVRRVFVDGTMLVDSEGCVPGLGESVVGGIRSMIEAVAVQPGEDIYWPFVDVPADAHVDRQTMTILAEEASRATSPKKKKVPAKKKTEQPKIIEQTVRSWSDGPCETTLTTRYRSFVPADGKDVKGFAAALARLETHKLYVGNKIVPAGTVRLGDSIVGLGRSRITHSGESIGQQRSTREAEFVHFSNGTLLGLHVVTLNHVNRVNLPSQKRWGGAHQRLGSLFRHIRDIKFAPVTKR